MTPSSNIIDIRPPTCIGKNLIGILAKDGQWVSDDGTHSLVAADDLFHSNPYDEIERLQKINGTLLELTRRNQTILVSNRDLIEPRDERLLPLLRDNEKGVQLAMGLTDEDKRRMIERLA